MDGSFFVRILSIVLINLILSGDNAVVIALACRNLPKQQQKRAIFWGSFGAVFLRIVLTFIAVWVLNIPFLKIIGGLLLIWMAIKLLLDDQKEEQIDGSKTMLAAIKTIIAADFIMSFDNVVAVAGSANGNMLLIVISLAISIPLIIWGSQVLMVLMNRYPIIIVIGAALLGYTSGEMIISDKSIDQWLLPLGSILGYGVPLLLAGLVVLIGKWINHSSHNNGHQKDHDHSQRKKKHQYKNN